jgi:hypothetical protein
MIGTRNDVANDTLSDAGGGEGPGGHGGFDIGEWATYDDGDPPVRHDFIADQPDGRRLAHGVGGFDGPHPPPRLDQAERLDRHLASPSFERD